MTELQSIKLNRMVLIRSGKFDFADFDIESPIHLSGGNRNGKTTLINAIQFAISYDLKECSWDGHDLEATKKHYFGQGAYILFDFDTSVGPHSLMLRGLGALDKWKAEYEHWHGALDIEKFMNFHSNGDPLSPKKWDDIQAYLLEKNSKKIEGKRDFDNFLFDDIGILKTKKKEDLRAFRMLFKDILGFSSIEDERLKKLFVGMWTEPKNRTINLSDKQDQLNELVRESSLLSKFDDSRQRIKNLLARYDEFEDDLYTTSESIAKINNTREKFVKNLLEQKSKFESNQTILSEEISKLTMEKTELDSQGRKDLKESGGLAYQLEEISNQLEYIRKINPSIKIEIHELRSEYESIQMILAAKKNADLDDGESIEKRLERITMQMDSLKAQLNGKSSLKGILREGGFSSEDLTFASVVFNQDLLTTIPEGTLSESAIGTLRNLIKLQKDEKIANFDSMVLDTSTIPIKEVKPQKLRSELDIELQTLENRNRKLQSDKKMIDEWGKTQKRFEELKSRISLGEKDIKLLDEEPEFQKSLEKTNQSLINVQNNISERDKLIERITDSIIDKNNQIKHLQNKQIEIMNQLQSVDEKFNALELNDFIVPHESDKMIEVDEFLRTLEQVNSKCAKLWKERSSIFEEQKEIFNLIERIHFMSDLEEGIYYLRNEDERFENKKQIQESDVRAFFASLTDNLQRFMESIDKINREVRTINNRLKKTSISNLDSVQIKVDIIDSDIHNLIKSVLYENVPQKTLFIESKAEIERLESLMKKGELSLSSILGLKFIVNDEGTVTSYSNLKKIESTGTTLAIKVAIYSEIIGGMLSKGASIPIFIDEVGDLDDENFYTIIQYIMKRKLNPVTATPRVTWVIPEFYHLVGTGNHKILDEKNRSSWKRKVDAVES
jgi:DNA repair exonuclease SbcCD ATPase subunit